MKKLINAQDIIEELKESDLETYLEIKSNTEIEKNKYIGRGGKRAGAGRRKLSSTSSKTRTVRLSDEEYDKFKKYGGVKWLREKLKEVS